MTMNFQSQILLEKIKNSGDEPIYLLSVKGARARRNRQFLKDTLKTGGNSGPDRYIPCPWGKLRVRIYNPKSGVIETEKDIQKPVVLFCHGGGWVHDSLDTHDDAVRHLAEASQCIFVSVDYRLAPEWKFPCAVEDCYTALQWVKDNAPDFGGDPERLAVCGDSAGGNLAAVICQLARDRGGVKIKCQVLLYPNTDYVLNHWQSAVTYGSDYSLTTNALIWYFNHYVKNDEDRKNPYLCPLQAESLAGLPAAYVLTAKYDPLLDEGEAYARKLEEHGVEVRYQCCERLMHGYLLYGDVIDEVREIIVRIGHYLNEKLW